PSRSFAARGSSSWLCSGAERRRGSRSFRCSGRSWRPGQDAPERWLLFEQGRTRDCDRCPTQESIQKKVRLQKSETMNTSTTRKLFGTDGIRGIAGEPPLDTATVFAAGLAIGHSLRKTASKPKVILGRDTRESSVWIASTIAAGLRETGAAVESAGVVPTPAVAFLAHTHGFDTGIVISASHNPWRDNGIKLFGADGFKLPDALELAIEDEILHHAAKTVAPDPSRLPPIEDNADLQAD